LPAPSLPRLQRVLGRNRLEPVNPSPVGPRIKHSLTNQRVCGPSALAVSPAETGPKQKRPGRTLPAALVNRCVARARCGIFGSPCATLFELALSQIRETLLRESRQVPGIQGFAANAETCIQP